MRVFVLEDNEIVVEIVRAAFEEKGWEVVVAESCAQAKSKLAQAPFDAAVLDIELPDGDGYTVLSAIRARPSYVPVVMLTARSGPAAVINGLDAGADDYLVKPFDPEELIARVTAIVRRSGRGEEVLQVGDVSFNRMTREITAGGTRVRLTPKEQILLEQLMLTPGTAVTRELLLQRVWRMTFDPNSNLLETNITRLRQKLKAAGANVVISARRSEGFALVPLRTISNAQT